MSCVAWDDAMQTLVVLIAVMMWIAVCGGGPLQWGSCGGKCGTDCGGSLFRGVWVGLLGRLCWCCSVAEKWVIKVTDTLIV